MVDLRPSLDFEKRVAELSSLADTEHVHLRSCCDFDKRTGRTVAQSMFVYVPVTTQLVVRSTKRASAPFCKSAEYPLTALLVPFW